MRVVQDALGSHWICLEVPARGDEPQGQQRLECNSGAVRVEILVPEAWDELADGALLDRIARAQSPA